MHVWRAECGGAARLCGGRGPLAAASDGDPLGGARHPISSGDEGENAGDGGEGDGGVFWMGFDGDKKPLICAINSSMPPVRLTQVRCSQGPRQQRWESSLRKTTTECNRIRIRIRIRIRNHSDKSQLQFHQIKTDQFKDFKSQIPTTKHESQSRSFPIRPSSPTEVACKSIWNKVSTTR